MAKKEKNFFIDKTSKLQENCTIYPGVVIEKNCKIGKNVTIQSGTIITNSVIIEDNCFIGPFSVLRDKTKISKNSLIGPHCEIVRSTIGENSKISHRAYVGDCLIGNKVFFGCGVVVANTNFEKRFKTKIGSNTKIGASSTLISPITIGENCFIAAGTILSKNIKSNTKIRMNLNYKLEKN